METRTSIPVNKKFSYADLRRMYPNQTVMITNGGVINLLNNRTPRPFIMRLHNIAYRSTAFGDIWYLDNVNNLNDPTWEIYNGEVSVKN